MGPLSDVLSGLIRCDAEQAAELWARLVVRGRRAIVDRREAVLVLERAQLRDVATPAGVTIRPAVPADLAPLVDAARASLREEGRPDPFLGDPKGFRRWVAARVGRARVAEIAGEVVWVGYADVRLAEGHLLQGVYTWPAHRRRGVAAAGVAALCHAAFGRAPSTSSSRSSRATSRPAISTRGSASARTPPCGPSCSRKGERGRSFP